MSLVQPSQLRVIDVAQFDDGQIAAYRDWYMEQTGEECPRINGICTPDRSMGIVRIIPTGMTLRQRVFLMADQEKVFDIGQFVGRPKRDIKGVVKNNLIRNLMSKIDREMLDGARLSNIDGPSRWRKIANLMLLVAEAQTEFDLRLSPRHDFFDAAYNIIHWINAIGYELIQITARSKLDDSRTKSATISLGMSQIFSRHRATWELVCERMSSRFDREPQLHYGAKLRAMLAADVDHVVSPNTHGANQCQ